MIAEPPPRYRNCHSKPMEVPMLRKVRNWSSMCKGGELIFFIEVSESFSKTILALKRLGYFLIVSPNKFNSVCEARRTIANGRCLQFKALELNGMKSLHATRSFWGIEIQRDHPIYALRDNADRETRLKTPIKISLNNHSLSKVI